MSSKKCFNFVYLTVLSVFINQSCIFKKSDESKVEIVTWAEVKNCENKSCLNYQFPIENEIHYVGENGFYAVSLDSGKTIEIREFIISGDYNVIQFTNVDSGYLLTDDSLYLSIDRGKTWKTLENFDIQNCGACNIDQSTLGYYNIGIEVVSQNIPDFDVLYASFLTESLGYIMGDQVSSRYTAGRGENITKWIFKTTDEGANWNKLYEKEGGYNKGFYMFEEKSGFFVEETSDPEDVLLLFTDDEWKSIDVCFKYRAYQVLCTKRFSKSNVMIILYYVGGDDEIALVTNDNGCNWYSYAIDDVNSEGLGYYAEINENEEKLCSW